ncbi:MAG: response regulator transcription factor [Bacteroidia bacterium]|nr:response regulator transcription factor [Bacteroidia bacterium]
MTNKIVKVLTARETQILKLICQEKTNLEIAKKLKISEYGVDYHRRNLYKKTGAKTIIGLFKVAIKNNIVKL